MKEIRLPAPGRRAIAQAVLPLRKRSTRELLAEANERMVTAQDHATAAQAELAPRRNRWVRP
jgi:hypothetical protein